MLYACAMKMDWGEGELQAVPQGSTRPEGCSQWLLLHPSPHLYFSSKVYSHSVPGKLPLEMFRGLGDSCFQLVGATFLGSHIVQNATWSLYAKGHMVKCIPGGLPLNARRGVFCAGAAWWSCIDTIFQGKVISPTPFRHFGCPLTHACPLHIPGYNGQWPKEGSALPMHTP